MEDVNPTPSSAFPDEIPAELLNFFSTYVGVSGVGGPPAPTTTGGSQGSGPSSLGSDWSQVTPGSAHTPTPERGALSPTLDGDATSILPPSPPTGNAASASVTPTIDMRIEGDAPQNTTEAGSPIGEKDKDDLELRNVASGLTNATIAAGVLGLGAMAAANAATDTAAAGAADVVLDAVAPEVTEVIETPEQPDAPSQPSDDHSNPNDTGNAQPQQEEGTDAPTNQENSDEQQPTEEGENSQTERQGNDRQQAEEENNSRQNEDDASKRDNDDRKVEKPEKKEEVKEDKTEDLRQIPESEMEMYLDSDGIIKFRRKRAHLPTSITNALVGSNAASGNPNDPAIGHANINVPNARFAASLRARRGSRRGFTKVWTKIGDNTVYTDASVKKETACKTKWAPCGEPNFLRSYGASFAGAHATQIAWVPAAHTIRISSYMSLNAVGGGLEEAVELQGNILNTQANWVILANRNTFTISFHTGKPTGQSADFSAHPEMISGSVANERAITSRVLPALGIRDQASSRHLSAAFNTSMNYYDNSAIYAKLMYYAFCLEVMELVNPLGAWVWVAAPAGEAPNWRNLNVAGGAGAQLDSTGMVDDITSRRLVLIDPEDTHFAADEQVILWLLYSGNRIEAPAGAEYPHMVHVHWPAIPISIWGRDAAPAAWGAVGAVTSAQLINFATNLATKRSETDALMRGIYIAMDICGIKMEVPAGGPGAGALQCEFVTCDMRMRGISLPRPADYNPMHRIMRFAPKPPEYCIKEAQAMLGQDGDGMVRLLVLYNACLAAMTTTFYTSYNLRTEHLSQYTSNAALNTDVYKVARMGIWMLPSILRNHEIAALSMPRRMMTDYLGANVCEGLYQGMDMNNGRGNVNVAQANTAYQGSPNGIPPRRVVPWCIFNWINMVPIEWGLSINQTKVDFTKEVVVNGPFPQQGWYADMGSNDYMIAADGIFPYAYCPYGAMALNAIDNALRLAAGLPLALNVTPRQWAPGGKSSRMAAVAYPWPLHQNALLACMEPCTIISYNYENGQVLPPALLGPNLPAANRNQIRRCNGTINEWVGYGFDPYFHNPQGDLGLGIMEQLAELYDIVGDGKPEAPPAEKLTSTDPKKDAEALKGDASDPTSKPP